MTTNLWGERWSKLAVNCMVNPISGLSGYDSAEVRTDPVPRRIAVFTAAEVIQVGRARGYEVEPIYGIDAQRFVDAAAGQGPGARSRPTWRATPRAGSAAGRPCSRT